MSRTDHRYCLTKDETHSNPNRLADLIKALSPKEIEQIAKQGRRQQLAVLSANNAHQAIHFERLLAKYNDQEPRDWHGRWTTGGAEQPSVRPKSRRKPKGHATSPRRSPVPSPPQRPGDYNQHPTPTPTAHSRSDKAVLDPRLQALFAMQPALEREFDDLGPVEFSKRVYRFGNWLEINGSRLNPEERASAFARYAFLQDRLSFWIGYPFLPPRAHGNLLSAAQTLYSGATNSGLVRIGGKDGGLPKSMLAVAAASMAYEGPSPALAMSRLASGSRAHGYVSAPIYATRVVGLGGEVDNLHAEIQWGRGIIDQGDPWEKYILSQLSSGGRNSPGSKTWDLFDERNGHAISAKTLDTTTYTYVSRPGKIFSVLSNYINSAAKYNLKSNTRVIDLNANGIASRQLQLAVPADTSPIQWPQIQRAVYYGRTKGINVVVTRIR